MSTEILSKFMQRLEAANSGSCPNMDSVTDFKAALIVVSLCCLSSYPNLAESSGRSFQPRAINFWLAGARLVEAPEIVSDGL
jgi:hypothetical protein